MHRSRMSGSTHSTLSVQRKPFWPSWMYQFTADIHPPPSVALPAPFTSLIVRPPVYPRQSYPLWRNPIALRPPRLSRHGPFQESSATLLRPCKLGKRDSQG